MLPPHAERHSRLPPNSLSSAVIALPRDFARPIAFSYWLLPAHQSFNLTRLGNDLFGGRVYLLAYLIPF